MFPLLISNFARTWHIKLVGATMLSFLIVAVCFALGIDWAHGAFPVIVGFPLARLLEFVLGMCAALLWRRLPTIHVGPVYGTALELAALGFVVLASHLAVRVPNPGSAPSAWLAICALPSVPAALLIVAMAMNRGMISRALSFPAAVFLGEISYSVYLLHGLIAYVLFFRLPQMSPAQMSATYIATLLAVAAVTWYFVERPARIALTSEAWIRRRSPEIVPEIP
jgi:peptidoglycan/LPS O-acetylase OafA/YrhL